MAASRLRGGKVILFVAGAAKAEHISTVIGDLEGPESIVRIGQFLMHGDSPT